MSGALERSKKERKKSRAIESQWGCLQIIKNKNTRRRLTQKKNA
jgi:hypothetical protein